MANKTDHDRAVRFIAASRFPFPGQTDWPADNVTLTNETERKRGIETPSGTHFPDIVIVGGNGAGAIREVAEVETTVGEAEARIWALSSAASDNKTKTGVKHFFVYVPPGLEQQALELLQQHAISHAGLRTWRVDAAGRVHVVPIVTTGDAKDHVESLSEPVGRS
jgi:hypothetical protein